MANYVGLSKPVLINDANANVDYLYGPYDSVSAACTAIASSLRKIGKTVGITDNTGVTEYWFKDGIADSNLVVKSAGGSSVSSTIYTVTSATETTTYLNNAFPSAKVNDKVVNTGSGAVYLKYTDTGWVKLAGTILTDTAPTVATVTSAEVISYK